MTQRKYLTLQQLKKKQLISKSRKQIGASLKKLPAVASLRSQVQEVYDQGSEGSCTANAFCGAFRMMQSDKSFKPSRQYVYFKERLIEAGNDASVVTDSGAEVLDAIGWVSKTGVCSEQSWPYDPSTVNTEPPSECDLEALSHKMGGSVGISVGNNNAIKSSIVSGVPVLLAIAVYQSFESSQGGIIPMPGALDQFLGGHEILIVGYSDVTKCFEVLNSWGTSWGDYGFCHIPYAYLSDPKLTYELYTIQKFQDS